MLCSSAVGCRGGGICMPRAGLRIEERFVVNVRREKKRFLFFCLV